MTFRHTFGIKHEDVISASLDKVLITSLDFDSKILVWKNNHYILHCDPAVRKTLGFYGEAECIVSFQHRKNGFFALARLYRTNKS